MPAADFYLPATSLPPQKILVRGLNWLGDAVMSTPALQRLREARPDAHITLLTPAKLADLWLHHPDVDAVLPFQNDESVFHIARRLRAEKFQISLILPNSVRSALEVFLARIPQRIGYARPWRKWFLTQLAAPSPNVFPMRKRSVAEIKGLVRNPTVPSPQSIPASAHHIYHYLHLATSLGANPEPALPRLVVTDAETQAIRQRFKIFAEQNERHPWFGLNPGAEYGPAKRWPAERYAAAAIELQRRTQCRWLILGGNADMELATRIANEIRAATTLREPVLNLAGQTTLRELCAALKLCLVVVTNDSGPMHVAAAVGSRVVVPFGSTSPELTGPGQPGDVAHVLLKSRVPCAPCFRRVCPIDFRCMRQISVEQVVQAALQAASPGSASYRHEF